MAGETKEGAQRNRFLLGGASEAERERLEAEFFADDDAFQEMLTAEDDLIDAYARGELATNERRQFEQRFLNSSEGKERVQFARAFANATVPQTVTSPPEVSSTTSPGFFASIFGRAPAWRIAFATIAVAAFVGYPWLLVERSRMNQELNELRAERGRLSQQAEELARNAEAERARSADLQAQLAANTANPTRDVPVPERRDSQPREKEIGTHNASIGTQFQNPNITPVTVSYDLTPGTTRGGAGNSLQVPAKATSISLKLGLETEAVHDKYRAFIETAEGRSVRQVDSLNQNRNTTTATGVRIDVPAQYLPPGDYVLFLRGESASGAYDPVATYSFKILKK